jgi:hypothetical protein
MDTIDQQPRSPSSRMNSTFESHTAHDIPQQQGGHQQQLAPIGTGDTGRSTGSSPPATTPPPLAGNGRRPTSSPADGQRQPPKKRNRPTLSCVQCRARKIKCDRNTPCTSCDKTKIKCTYDDSRRARPAWAISPAPSAGPQGAHQHHPRGSPQPQQQPPLSQSTTFGNGPIHYINGHVNRASAQGAGSVFAVPTRLHHAASLTSPATLVSVDSTVSSPWQGTGQADVPKQRRIWEQEQRLPGNVKANDLAVHSCRDAHLRGLAPESVSPIPSGILSKSRYFGQSHWMYGVRFVSVSILDVLAQALHFRAI